MQHPPVPAPGRGRVPGRGPCEAKLQQCGATPRSARNCTPKAAAERGARARGGAPQAPACDGKFASIPFAHSPPERTSKAKHARRRDELPPNPPDRGNPSAGPRPKIGQHPVCPRASGEDFHDWQRRAAEARRSGTRTPESRTAPFGDRLRQNGGGDSPPRLRGILGATGLLSHGAGTRAAA